MLSIEETFEAAFRAGEDFYLLPRDATGEVVAKSESRLRSAIRAGFLAVLESHMAEVDRVAEAEMLAGNNPLAGAHYRAMRTVAAKQRAIIKALGEEGALNVFPERVDEVEALGNESSEEVRYDRLAGKRLPVMEKENVPATKAEDDGSHWRRLGVKGGMNW